MTLLGLLFQSGTHDVNLVGRAMHSMEKIFILKFTSLRTDMNRKPRVDCNVHCVHEEETWWLMPVSNTDFLVDARKIKFLELFSE